MALSNERLSELAEMMNARLDALANKGARPTRPYRVVHRPQPTLYDSITRVSVLRRVRYLSRAYGLAWLIDQATFNKPNLDCLEDEELSVLLRDMERARECPEADISFADAGLVRDTTIDLPGDHVA